MIAQLIKKYETGSSLLSHCIANMTEDQLGSHPIADRWSVRQVICHIADFEPIYADRMKRVIAEDVPTFFGSHPDRFTEKLCYESHDLANELRVIEVTRIQMSAILKTLEASDFERTGMHSRDGELTLKTLLERITGHIPHHVETIEVKKRALGL